MLKIDELPTEILIKIFGYLRRYGNVSLVSKQFYDVACKVHGSNVCVSFSSIFQKNESHQSVMASVRNTRRKISKLSLDIGDPCLIRKSAISDALAIVTKFSATIKYFELRQVTMEMSEYLKMLSLLPNVEHLVFYAVTLEKQSSRNHLLTNECLNLRQLKTLEVEEFPEFEAVFNRLPAGVLKKLTIQNWSFNWRLLTGLFAQQSNLKDLLILVMGQNHDSTLLPDHIFDHLKLESLDLYQAVYKSSHATTLSKQTKLTNLCLRRYPLGTEADDHILNAIANRLTELETLAISVDRTEVVAFQQIEKFKKLKHLTLEFCPVKLIETLAALDNSRITTLNINQLGARSFSSVNVIGALANSLPNLKVLRFDDYCSCEVIGAIMQHFNFLEVLGMQFGHDDANGLSRTIEVDRCSNPKLTELNISARYPCDEYLLTKLAAVYPHLKKLHIYSSSSITTQWFKAVLNEFKTTESLTLHFRESPFSTEFLQCITENKSNLQSLTLGRFDSKYKFTAEHKGKLSAAFDVTKYRDGTLYLTN